MKTLLIVAIFTFAGIYFVAPSQGPRMVADQSRQVYEKTDIVKRVVPKTLLTRAAARVPQLTYFLVGLDPAVKHFWIRWILVYFFFWGYFSFISPSRSWLGLERLETFAMPFELLRFLVALAIVIGLSKTLLNGVGLGRLLELLFTGDIICIGLVIIATALASSAALATDVWRLMRWSVRGMLSKIGSLIPINKASMGLPLPNIRRDEE